MAERPDETRRLIAKYKSDLASLEETEEDLARRIQIMENMVPTVLVWFMWKSSQEKRRMPFPHGETEEEAQRKLVHLETILEELQEAEFILKEEENVLRSRIEELEAYFSKDYIDPYVYKRSLSSEDLETTQSENIKKPNKKEIKFTDLLEDSNTDWQKTCEELFEQVDDLTDNLKHTMENLKTSEEQVKKLKESISQTGAKQFKHAKDEYPESIDRIVDTKEEKISSIFQDEKAEDKTAQEELVDVKLEPSLEHDFGIKEQTEEQTGQLTTDNMKTEYDRGMPKMEDVTDTVSVKVERETEKEEGLVIDVTESVREEMQAEEESKIIAEKEEEVSIKEEVAIETSKAAEDALDKINDVTEIVKEEREDIKVLQEKDDLGQFGTGIGEEKEIDDIISTRESIPAEATFLEEDTFPTEDTLPKGETIPSEVTSPAEDKFLMDDTLPTKETFPAEATFLAEDNFSTEGTLPTDETIPADVTSPAKDTLIIDDTLPMKETIQAEATFIAEDTFPTEDTLPTDETISADVTSPAEDTLLIDDTLPTKETIPAGATFLAEDTFPTEDTLPTDETITADVTYPADDTLLIDDTLPRKETILAEATFFAEDTFPPEDTLPTGETIPAEATFIAEDTFSTEGTLPTEETIQAEVTFPAEETLPAEDILPSDTTREDGGLATLDQGERQLFDRTAADSSEAQAITSEPFEVPFTDGIPERTPSGLDFELEGERLKARPSADSLTTQTLQSKCRVKDHLIKSMADQLRDLARNNVWSGSSLLENTSEDPVHTYDFDRTTLFKYLKGEEPTNFAATMTPSDSYTSSNPLNVKILRKLDKDSLLIEWGPPPSPEVVGFQIFINGEFMYWVHSAKRNKALLHPLDLTSQLDITVSPVDAEGNIVYKSSLTYTPQ